MMIEKDKKRFAQLIGTIGEMAGKEVSKDLLLLYWNVLHSQFDNIAEFEKATIKLLNTWNYSYMPKPAHFLEQTRLSDDEVVQIANESWSDVIGAIRDGVGYTKSAVFECPITEYALNSVGGISKLCTKTSEELEWIKKDFVKIFISAYKTNRVGKIELKNKGALLDDTKKKVISSRFAEKQLLKIAHNESKHSQISQNSDKVTSLLKSAIKTA